MKVGANVSTYAYEQTYRTIIDGLRHHMTTRPRGVAFVFLEDGERESARITYAGLDSLARSIGARLREEVHPRERALILFEPGLEFIAAFFGCLYEGVIPVPASPPITAADVWMRRINRLLADSRASCVLVSNRLSAALDFSLDRSDVQIMRIPACSDCVVNSDAGSGFIASDSDPAFIQYTSGSTRAPRGVVVTHANLVHNLSGMRNRSHYDSETIFVSWLPPYHDMGLIGLILLPIYVGGCCVFMPPLSFLQRPFRWLQAISKYSVQTTAAPNFAFDLCVDKISPLSEKS